jgi:hypothetical protein
LLFVCELTLFTATAPLNAAILRCAPPAVHASAFALAILCSHLLGDLWSPSAVGVLADVASLDRAMWILPFALALGGATWWAASRARA